MWTWFFAFSLGAIGVFQAGLNRQIMKTWGLSPALLLNSIILFLIAMIFFLVCYRSPASFSDFLTPKLPLAPWKWWYLLPGIFGFILIAGVPLAITRLGALGVFLCIVVGQMVFSVIWDVQIENIPLDPRRIIGAVLAILGLVVSFWKH